MNKTLKLFALLGGILAFLGAILAGTIFFTYRYLNENVSAAVIESSNPDLFTIAKVNKNELSLEDEIMNHTELAFAADLKPIVYFSATWCPPCQAIKETIDDPLMVDAFSGTYIIDIDVDEWDEDLFAAGYYVDFIPAFAKVDPYGYPTGDMIDGGAWGEDIPVNMAPVLKTFFQTDELSQEASR